MTKLLDLTGRTFGRLRVIRRVENTKKGSARWECSCSCGNPETIIVQSTHLIQGVIQSCKCYMRERITEANKKFNEYAYESMNIMSGISSNTKEKFYFNSNQYEKIKNRCWRIDRKGYVVTNDSVTNEFISLHRLIMDFPDSDVDHKNRNPLDCTNENLRLATHQFNSINKSLQSNNSSGIAGVKQVKSGKWYSKLAFNGSVVFNKWYDSFDEAVYNRLLAEKKYFGEFAPQRHLFSEYGIS